MRRLYMEKIFYTEFISPVGIIFIASTEKGLCRIGFPCENRERVFSRIRQEWGSVDMIESSSINECTVLQLSKYFSGELKEFNCRLDIKGTEFQKRVWKELLEIPYGNTLSYRQIGEKAGRPKAYRAVGGAVGKNPVPIIIPCHRVISSDGSLGGFSGGMDVKRALLHLEAA